jgi:hypothetical protein
MVPTSACTPSETNRHGDRTHEPTEEVHNVWQSAFADENILAPVGARSP